MKSIGISLVKVVWPAHDVAFDKYRTSLMALISCIANELSTVESMCV